LPWRSPGAPPLGEVLEVDAAQVVADVEAAPPGITISTAEDGVPVDQLSSVAPVPGEPLPTTLSVPVQSAADEAVDTLSAPSYIVAVRTSTGADPELPVAASTWLIGRMGRRWGSPSASGRHRPSPRRRPCSP